MPMRSARFPLQDEFIAAVARTDGVYALWDGNTAIFYGIADQPGGLRGALESLETGGGPAGAQGATHFQVEPRSGVMTLRERVDDLLRQHFLETRSYPRCNLPEPLRARASLRVL